MGNYAEEDFRPGEFECPNCGEQVYEEIIVCPKCGLHFYPDELTGPGGLVEEPQGQYQEAAFSIPAVLAGWAISAVIAFFINLFGSRIWTPQSLGATGQLLVSAAGPIGALAGGYLAARIAGKRAVWHGLAVAMLSLVVAALLETYWYDLFSQPLRPATIISWMVLLAAGVFGAWIYSRMELAVRFPVKRKPKEQQLYYDLLALVRQDIDTAERLIAYERSRNPGAGRAKWIENALDRINRDRR